MTRRDNIWWQKRLFLLQPSKKHDSKGQVVRSGQFKNTLLSLDMRY